MYTVEDATFEQARAILSALARELDAQLASRSQHPVDLHELIRGGAPRDVEAGVEAGYPHSIAEKLEKSFPINELFPRGRRARSA
ncbi:MAG: hypothetical protein H0W81_01840 [Chloroflexi bacterium]|nr:hypothetical protein [Chloroflexota bacterium]